MRLSLILRHALSEEEIKGIEEGLKDLKSGKVISHDEFWKDLGME